MRDVQTSGRAKITDFVAQCEASPKKLSCGKFDASMEAGSVVKRLGVAGGRNGSESGW